MQDKKFEEVVEFVYLGARIANKCEEEKDIYLRLLGTNMYAGTINHLVRAKQRLKTAKNTTQ